MRPAQNLYVVAGRIPHLEALFGHSYFLRRRDSVKHSLLHHRTTYPLDVSRLPEICNLEVKVRKLRSCLSGPRSCKRLRVEERLNSLLEFVVKMAPETLSQQPLGVR
jgi:hypothetical protein